VQIEKASSTLECEEEVFLVHGGAAASFPQFLADVTMSGTRLANRTVSRR
jgi:hypothetical protein